VAIDDFGRTAGTGPRDAGFEARPHVGATTFAGLSADVAAGVAHLRSANGGDPSPRSIFTIGFCFGGRLAFLTASLGLNLAGVVGFYGWPIGSSSNDTPAPADIADQFDAPVLAIFGGADAAISPASISTFQAALARAGVDHQVVTYRDAPHSFFDRRAEEHAAASAAAWDATLDFIRSRTAPA
jgi:carboxymethylenebutenolidase